MITKHLRTLLLINNCLKNQIKLNSRGFATRLTTGSDLSYYHHASQIPLVHRTVGQQLEHSAAVFSSTEAVVSYHEGKRHTFASLLDEVNRLAAGFLKLRLKPGDCVAIWGPNNLQWYITMFAIARASLVSVGINPAFQGPEVEYCLRKVNVKAVVTTHTFKTQNYYDILCNICPEIPKSQDGCIKSSKFPHLQTVIIGSESKLPGTQRFEDVLASGMGYDAEALTIFQKTIDPDSACNIQFTSGTTGQPKAALLSHYNCVNNGIHIGSRSCLHDQRLCVQVPFFHVYGVVITIMSALSAGATLVTPAPSFDPAASLRAILDEKCTGIYGTPTMYVDLVRKQRELQLPITSTKVAFIGGSPCSPQLSTDIKETFNLDRMHNYYGLTETTSVVFSSNRHDTNDQVLHTFGQLLDHIEAKVVDEHGQQVPFGQPGELCIRGYAIMLGYFGDEKKTREIMGPDKWLKTGDQCVLQPDGYGRIVGRLKEMIIRGGENIFPKEIEDFLNTHPDIIETYVVGVPDERMGEEVCAFVRLRDNAKQPVTREHLKEYCKGKLAHFKVPRYVIQVTDFPKTTSGKIQKFKLRSLFEEKSKSKEL